MTKWRISARIEDVLFEKERKEVNVMKPKTLIGVMASVLTLGLIFGVFYYNKILNSDTIVYVPTLLETPELNEKEEEVVPERLEVYDGLTIEELTDKLNRILSSDLTNMGYAYANYSIELGVDPYLAVAISMHETGCKWNCSYLAKVCNNIGGQKGSGCGEYAAFDTLEDGIYAFIANIKKNYVDYGMITADEMNPKYAEDEMWSSKVNNYIEQIKNS